MGLLVLHVLPADHDAEEFLKPELADLTLNPQAASAGHDSEGAAVAVKALQDLGGAIDQRALLLCVVVEPEEIRLGPEVAREAEAFVDAVPVGGVDAIVAPGIERDAVSLKETPIALQAGGGRVEERAVPIEYDRVPRPGLA